MLKHKTLSLGPFYSLLVISYLLLVAGCATAPLVMPSGPQGSPGIYHRVEKSQTLWRISKIYNVDLDELATANHIVNASRIETGQLIFIPHRQKPQVSTYKSSTGHEDFIWPIKGKVVVLFGQTQTSNSMFNKGIDIQPYGSGEVVASRSGRVVFCADDLRGFGKTIIIDHGDGFSTIYARNSEVFVKINDSVNQKTVIAKAGSSGRGKNEYLHFEIRKGYLAQNPYFYLP